MCQRARSQGKRSFQLDLLDKISINHNDLNKLYYRPLVEQKTKLFDGSSKDNQNRRQTLSDVYTIYVVRRPNPKLQICGNELKLIMLQ